MASSSKTKRKTQDKRIPVDQYLSRRRLQRRWIAVVIVVSLAAICYADHHGWLLYDGGDWRRYHDNTFTVVAVIDGDTIGIAASDGDAVATHVRLWGVDTPEKADPEADQPAELFADEAAAYTKDVCDGQRVKLHLQVHQTRDRYGRLFAYVSLPDGSILNERLLAHGLARADDRFGHDQLDRYALFENQAQRDKVGLWSGANMK
jgi:micrococcal nuclease